MSDSPTTIDLPGYRILAPLGRGGMASVYLAQQVNLGREVAIKIMATHLAEQDASFGDRFLREARISGQLKHPHIVGVHDVGISGKYHYIAMEFHSGGVLKDRVSEGITVGEALRVTREIASALAYAHEQGFIHRDIKPDNILFRHDGGAVLMDFGIARAVNSDTQMTIAGAVVGTPHYMSPEQAMGRDLDHRSDIYSLGIVLYELLTGALPFQADSPLGICMQHVTEQPPPLPAHLEALQPLIDSLLAKSREDRIQTGRELADILGQIERQIGSDSETANMSAAASRVLNSVSSNTTNLSASMRSSGSGATVRASAVTKLLEPTLVGAPRVGSGRRLTIAAVAVVALALVGGGAWYVLTEQPDPAPVVAGSPAGDAPATVVAGTATDATPAADPAPAADAESARTLDLVEQARAALRVAPQAAPDTNPAWALLVELKSRDAVAAAGLIDQLATSYAAQASAALASDEAERARVELDSLQVVAPDHPQLAALRTAVTKAADRSQADRQFSDLLARAERQIQASQLSSPAGDNALVTIERAEQMNPGDPRVAALRERVARRYADLARDKRMAGDMAAARGMLARGSAVMPGLPVLATEQAELDRAERTTPAAAVAPAPQPAAAPDDPRDRQLSDLLDRADAALAAGRLVPPAPDSAFSLLEQALTADPGNARANAGLQAVRTRYMDGVQKMAAEGQLLGALAGLGAAGSIGISPVETASVQQQLAGRKLQEKLKDGSVAPELVFVPAGSFRMGDSAGTGFPQERPVHAVNISAPYMIGRFEVTFDEYDRFVAATGRSRPKDANGRGKQPVTNVTWADAQSYVDWLSSQTGARYRLPTEAEWEYAARANTATEFWWGDSIGTGRANCKNCGGKGGDGTLPVGSFPANGFGVHDTAGNVYEWTGSPYSNGYDGNDGTTAYRAGSGNPVARGGSWFDTDRFNRASMRLNLKPDFSSDFLGFRVVREP